MPHDETYLHPKLFANSESLEQFRFAVSWMILFVARTGRGLVGTRGLVAWTIGRIGLCREQLRHRHMPRIRAPTSMRAFPAFGLPLDPTAATGQVMHSKSGSNGAGMNRVREA